MTFLAAETSLQARLERRVAAQRRILSAAVPMPGDAKALFVELRKHLVDACDVGALATRQGDVFKLLKLAESPFGDLHQKAILGGEKDLKRRGTSPHFTRQDGAAFEFSIIVAERPGSDLVLFAYNFELRFPTGKEPRFIRFDLNEGGHDNEGRGLRCHMHPGHDDLQLPAPLLHPVELLDLLIYDAVHPSHPRAA